MNCTTHHICDCKLAELESLHQAYDHSEAREAILRDLLGEAAKRISWLTTSSWETVKSKELCNRINAVLGKK